MKGRILALVAAGSLIGSSCTRTGDPGIASPVQPTGSWRGGTLRIAMPPRTATQLDPVSYAPCPVFSMVHRLLLRELFSYPGLPAAEGGAIARPDLATRPPNVSADGLTWTIAIRPGLHYAPPYADREIVAADFVRALERLADPDVWDRPWGSILPYLSVIEGFDEVVDGRVDQISGLETPDEHTLVVRLSTPAGDLPYRLAFAAVSPIPEGAATGHPLDYIRFLAATGPYMIEGSEALDPSLPPGEQEPVSGFVPTTSLTLVRNPSWDPADDPLRAAYADRIEFSMPRYRELEDPALARTISSGRFDLAYSCAGMAPEQVAPFRDGRLTGTVHDETLAVGEYVPLNLATPPLDDLHVRRAVVLALDRPAYVNLLDAGRAFGTAVPISHIVPSALEAGLLDARWQPSWMLEAGPGIGAAHAEMRRSRYDADGDSRCDRCPSVRFVGDHDYGALLRRSLRRLGIPVHVHVPSSWDEAIALGGAPAARTSVIDVMLWAADYPSASSWFVPLFRGSSITDSYNNNLSLLGATDGQLEAWGYEIANVPSAETRMARCLQLLDRAQVECWAELDLWLMEEVVPVIPLDELSSTWVTSPRVVGYSFDAATGNPALDRIALEPGSE